MFSSENKVDIKWYTSQPVFFSWQKVYVDILH